jgi:hypothetical protein
MDGVILLSSKVGVSILTREFTPNYGLPLGQQQNDISLSGLIFALKLNADFAISQNDSSKPSLSSFSFGGSTIHFYVHDTFDILCAVFTRYEVVAEFNLGDFFAREICNKFCEKYPKVVAAQKCVRRKFNSFNDEISLIWREATIKHLSCIQQKLSEQFLSNWVYVCYSNDYSSILNRISPLTLVNNLHRSEISKSSSKVIPVSEFETETQTPRDTTLKNLNSATSTKTPTAKKPAEPISSKFKSKWKALFTRDKNKIKIKFVEDVVGDIQIYVKDSDSDQYKLKNIDCFDAMLSSFFCAGQLMSSVDETVQYMEMNMKVGETESKLVFFKQGLVCMCFPIFSDQKVNQQIVMYHLQPLLKQLEMLLQTIDKVSKSNEMPIQLNNIDVSKE